MLAKINGRERELPAGTTLSTLLGELAVSSGSIAVAVNDRVVPRAGFTTTTLADGDVVEIIQAVAGG